MGVALIMDFPDASMDKYREAMRLAQIDRLTAGALLHTAGSDGRQWRHLLNDTTVTDRFRCVAFDMPWHGKSSPPEGWPICRPSPLPCLRRGSAPREVSTRSARRSI